MKTIEVNVIFHSFIWPCAIDNTKSMNEQDSRSAEKDIFKESVKIVLFYGIILKALVTSSHSFSFIAVMFLYAAINF